MPTLDPTQIADAAQRTGLAGRRPTVAAAKEFIRWYLTTHPDYQRNPRGKDLYDQVGGKRRYRLKARVLELEVRGDSGQWVKVASQPLIDAALKLAGVAEGAAGETAKAAVQQRREQRSKRRTQQEERQHEQQIHDVALKVAAATDNIAQQVALGYEPRATLDQMASALKDRVRAQVDATGFPKRDEWLVSLDQPPWLPLIVPGTYQWVERVGDSAVAVRIQYVRPGYASVLIFAIREPGHMTIDPTREGAMPLIPWWKPEEIPLSYGDITGDLIVTKEGRLLPRMFTIGVAGEKRRGSGTWLMNVWCRLVRGYGVHGFVARKPRTEGRPFLMALARKGVIDLVSTEGDEWIAACPPARLLSLTRDIPFVSGPLPGRREPGLHALRHIAIDPTRGRYVSYGILAALPAVVERYIQLRPADAPLLDPVLLFLHGLREWVTAEPGDQFVPRYPAPIDSLAGMLEGVPPLEPGSLDWLAWTTRVAALAAYEAETEQGSRRADVLRVKALELLELAAEGLSRLAGNGVETWLEQVRQIVSAAVDRHLRLGRTPETHELNGPPPSSPFAWLHPAVVYGWEPIAARLDVSRVARHRPAAGGWLDVVRNAVERGQPPEREAIRHAIVAAERETKAPFEQWRADSHGRRLGGKSYRRETFTDNDDTRRPGDYGFMAFYDWATAQGIDLSQYQKADGSPDERRVAPDDRVGQFILWWLRNRHAFVSRHLAQIKNEPLYEPDGTPTRRHLGLIMWAASPDSDLVAPGRQDAVSGPPASPLLRQYFQLRSPYGAAEWMPSDWPDDYLLLARPTPGGQYDRYEAYGADAERLCGLLGYKMSVREGYPVCGSRSFGVMLTKLRKVAPDLHIAIAEPTGEDRWLEVTRLLAPVQTPLKLPDSPPGEVGRYPRDLLTRLSGTVRRIFMQLGLMSPATRKDLRVYTNEDGSSIHVAGGANIPNVQVAVLRAIQQAFPSIDITVNQSPTRPPGYVSLV